MHSILSKVPMVFPKWSQSRWSEPIISENIYILCDAPVALSTTTLATSKVSLRCFASMFPLVGIRLNVQFDIILVGMMAPIFFRRCLQCYETILWLDFSDIHTARDFANVCVENHWSTLYTALFSIFRKERNYGEAVDVRHMHAWKKYVNTFFVSNAEYSCAATPWRKSLRFMLMRPSANLPRRRFQIRF